LYILSRFHDVVSIEIRYLVRAAPEAAPFIIGRIRFVASIPEVTEVAPLGFVLRSSKLLHAGRKSNASPSDSALYIDFIFVYFIWMN
jgi:hypothetical protein